MRLLKWTAVSFALLVSPLAVIATVILFAWQELPDVSQLADYRPKMPLRIYAKNGEKIAEFGEGLLSNASGRVSERESESRSEDGVIALNNEAKLVDRAF